MYFSAFPEDIFLMRCLLLSFKMSVISAEEGFFPPHALQSYILSQGITSCCQRSATSRPPPPPVGQRAASLPRPEKAVQ